MSKVLLVSMPFAQVKLPSTGLSALKSSCIAHGLSCDLAYLSARFRSYADSPGDYDLLHNYWLTGDWVFGEELFGSHWAAQERGGIDHLVSVLSRENDFHEGEDIRECLLRLRRLAGPFLEDCLEAIPWQEYDVIGFTSVLDQQTASLALARRIKENWPDKVVALGGPTCDGEMGLTLASKFPFVDWVFSGEADFAFPRAVQGWAGGESLDSIQGLIRQENGVVKDQGYGRVENLDELPTPDFSDHYAALGKYAPDLLEPVVVFLQYSRGCWWGASSQCVFCSLNRQALDYRYKSPELALEETRQVVETYGVEAIQVVDTVIAPRYFRELCPLLEPLNLAAFFVETRANLTREELGLLKQAGSSSFQPGIESLDTEMLQFMCKGTSLAQVVQCLKWCREYGLRPRWNFLHSLPGENPQAYRRMADLVPLLLHLPPPCAFRTMSLQRYSPIFLCPHRWGVEEIRAHPLYRCMYPFDQETLDRLAYMFEYSTGNGYQGAGSGDGARTGEDSPGEEPGDYLEPVLAEVRAWQELWEQEEPPLLGYARQKDGRATVFDARPGSRRREVELDPRQLQILELCDRGICRDDLARALDGGERGPRPAGRGLEEDLRCLVEQRFLIKDGDLYLGLVNDLEILAREGHSVVARVLCG